MEKRRIITLASLLFLVVLLSGCVNQKQEVKQPSEVIFLSYPKVTSQEIVITSQIEVVSQVPGSLELYHNIQEIALDIATNCSYDVLKYNCWDYSTDLKRALVSAGYNARIRTGTVNCTSGLFDEKICKSFGGLHDWVELKSGNETIWIEATTGQLITNEEKQYYHPSGYSTEKYNNLKKCIK